MFLLERLESQIATGHRRAPTRKVLVDKDAILDLIDQLRVAVPEEIHAAKRINAEASGSSRRRTRSPAGSPLGRRSRRRT
jgi:hypothetical protein